MKKNFLTLICFLLFAVVFMAITSCGKEDKPGCTDPDALNYVSDANMDDGTCEYARDKFLGNYSGTSECIPNDLWDSNDFQFGIHEDPKHVNNVIVRFPDKEVQGLYPGGFSIPWIATVNNNSLFFDNSTFAVGPGWYDFTCSGNRPFDVTLKLTGTATLTGNQLNFPNFRYSVIDDDTGITECVMSCEIEAVK